MGVPADTELQKCTNHLENAFGRMGIHISKRAYNQLELFVSSFPGNCYSLNEEYDRFPVSYTHLDVYKRQSNSTVKPFPLRLETNLSVGLKICCKP